VYLPLREGVYIRNTSAPAEGANAAARDTFSALSDSQLFNALCIRSLGDPRPRRSALPASEWRCSQSIGWGMPAPTNDGPRNFHSQMVNRL